MARKPLFIIIVGLMLLAGLLLATTGISLVPVSVALGPCLRDWTAVPSWSRRASPLATVRLVVGGEPVELCYGRPSARGREVFGHLVPYDSLWRLGANEPTRLYSATPLDLGSLRVPPGRYSMYAAPTVSTWTFYLSRAILQWGIPIDSAVRAREIGHFSVPSESMADLVDTMTIHPEPGREGGATLVIEWEHTRVRIPVAPVKP